jgi:hypothetical protein
LREPRHARQHGDRPVFGSLANSRERQNNKPLSIAAAYVV